MRAFDSGLSKDFLDFTSTGNKFGSTSTFAFAFTSVVLSQIGNMSNSSLFTLSIRFSCYVQTRDVIGVRIRSVMVIITMIDSIF